MSTSSIDTHLFSYLTVENLTATGWTASQTTFSTKARTASGSVSFTSQFYVNSHVVSE